MGTDEEFYANAAQKRFNEINQQRLRAQHDLALSLSQGDEDDASREIQQIANLDSEQANLVALAQREVARNQPAAAPSEDAWRTKRTEEMGHEDIRQMINQTIQHKLS